MKKLAKLSEFQPSKETANLWMRDGKHYRLAGKGITPNGCWRIGAAMVRLIDICAETGADILAETVDIDDIGTVPAALKVIRMVAFLDGIRAAGEGVTT